MFKSVNLDERPAETNTSSIKDKNYGISYSDDDNIQECWNNQTEAKLVDENYKEKLMALLNKEFVQVKYFTLLFWRKHTFLLKFDYCNMCKENANHSNNRRR